MKNFMVLGGLLICLLAMLSGCGSNNPSNPAAPAPQVVLDQSGNPLPSVDGTWQSICQSEPVHGGGPVHQRTTYSIHGDQVTYVVQQFADDQCASAGVEVTHYDGHYQSVKSINNERGARQVNLKFDTCKGNCNAYGKAEGNNVYAAQQRVFKVDGGKFYAGSQSSNGSVEWDFNVGFTKISSF